MRKGLYTLLLLFIYGCTDSIHEFPEESSGVYADITIVDIERCVQSDLHHTEVVQQTRATNYDLRFIIDVYTTDGSWVTSQVITTTDLIPTTHCVQARFRLPANRYRFVLWSDYVLPGSKEDTYFHTTYPEEITFAGAYMGNTHLKDAYTITEEIDLRGQGNKHIEKSFSLRRPFARIQVIATDREKFQQTHLNEVQTTIAYPGFVYNGFNPFLATTTGTTSGWHFTGTSTPLSSNELLLGWDYIWAGNQESKTKINLQIRDENGKVLNTLTNIEIPYVREKLTIIKGEFLTGRFSEESGGGIGVITEYEGEIEVKF